MSRDMNHFLEMPGSDTVDSSISRSTNQNYNIPATPSVKEQRSIESIFKVLNGENIPVQEITTVQQETIIEQTTKPEKPVVVTLSETQSTCHFDLFDQSLFSPSPPKETASQPCSGFSSSLEGFINNKIDTLGSPSYGKNNAESVPLNNATKNLTQGFKESQHCSGLFETVDYCDIFGSEEEVETETFVPTVLDFSTQKNSQSQQILENTSGKEHLINNKSKLESKEKVMETISEAHIQAEEPDIVAEELEIPESSMWDEVEIPTCGMWNVDFRDAVHNDGEIKHRRETLNQGTEQESKRRKLSNFLTAPRLFS